MARAPPCQMRAVMSPMVALVAGSRTTMKTKGWAFSALGAWVAALRICSMTASGTGSGRKDRAARWLCTTSKKSGGIGG